MFEDSTFESTGRIRSRSRNGVIAALLLNGSILFALALLPLVYPEALPRQMLTMLLEAPAPLPPPSPAVEQDASNAKPQSAYQAGRILVPLKAPRVFTWSNRPEIEPRAAISGLEQAMARPAIPGGLFASHPEPRVAHTEVKGPVHLSSGVVAGLLIEKTPPIYPSIAKAMHVEGVVVLQASISKAGIIENLRVESGPAVLQQAAMNAVSQWRYRPYLLNGEPVEVETTVNVIFSFGH